MKKRTARGEHHKDGPDFCTAGIDISKQHLDAYELPSGCEARFSNTREGVRAFGTLFVLIVLPTAHQLGRRQAVANPREPSHENAVRRLGPPPFQSNLNRYADQNRNTRIGDWKA